MNQNTTTAPQAFSTGTSLSLQSNWNMLKYVAAMKALVVPTSIPALDTPPPIDIPTLYQNCINHANAWEPVHNQMVTTAGTLHDYAIAAIAYVNQMVSESDVKLNPTAFAALTAAQKTALQQEFTGMVQGLKDQASANEVLAKTVKEAIHDFGVLIANDGTDAASVEAAYQSWITAEDKTIEAYEKAEGVQSSAALISAIGDKISTLQSEINTETLKIGFESAGVAVGAVLVFVFPPLGIAGVVASAVELAKDVALKKAYQADVTTYQNELNEVTRYNNIKVFFSATKAGLDAIQAEVTAAEQMLGLIEGNWALLATDLDTIANGFSGVNQLTPFSGWNTPIQQWRAAMPLETYTDIQTQSDIYIRNAFVTVGDFQ